MLSFPNRRAWSGLLCQKWLGLGDALTHNYHDDVPIPLPNGRKPIMAACSDLLSHILRMDEARLRAYILELEQALLEAVVTRDP